MSNFENYITNKAIDDLYRRKNKTILSRSEMLSELKKIGLVLAPVNKKRRIPKAPSKCEELFYEQCKQVGLPLPEREYRFTQERKWRADFCWPDYRVIIEVEGLTRGIGRHTSFKGFAGDCEKYANAAIMGYTVLRFEQTMVKSGKAIELTKQLLETKGCKP